MKLVAKFKTYTLGANQTFHVYNAVVTEIHSFTTMNGKELMSIKVKDRKGSIVGSFKQEIYDLIEDLLDIEMSIVLWKRSNEKDDYSRNFIRNTIMPQVTEMYPNANENIVATAQRLKEAEQIVLTTVNDFWKKGMKLKKGMLSVSIAHWQKVLGNATYTWGLIKEYGFNSTQIEEVHKILSASNGAYIASDTHQLMKWGDQVQVISKEEGGEYLVIEKVAAIVETKYGKLHFELIEQFNMEHISKNANTAYLDASQLSWPLLLRTWSSSDYFYPLGLGKKKKLNHFLSNFKLSPTEKNRTAVLCSGDKIGWVVGKRIDDRFKIKANTPFTLKISWQEMA